MKEVSQAIANIKQEIQLSEWAKDLERQRETDLGVDEWCKKVGIKRSTYYYRLRRVREHLSRATGKLPQEVECSAVSSPQIVPIQEIRQIPSESNVEIQCGEICVSFSGTVTANGLNVERYFTDVLSSNDHRLALVRRMWFERIYSV